MSTYETIMTVFMSMMFIMGLIRLVVCLIDVFLKKK